MDPVKMCHSKRQFNREGKAEHALVDMRRKEKPGADLCHVYACPICDKWHIGGDSVPREVQKEIKVAIAARKKYIKDQEVE